MEVAAEIPVTGNADVRTEELDKFIMEFMEKQQAAGVAVAVTRHGKLVYARGFGWADREEKRPVQANSLFRIASISKPVTAVAVMQLVQAGKLDLRKTHPLVELKIPVTETPGFKGDPRQEKITVEELLQHRGGFDRGASFDPMFKSVEFAQLCGTQPPAMQNEVIRVMQGRPLDYEPGEKYAYSNYGYCVLGREIERVTGQGYEAYVRQHVLKPIGITEMRLGRTHKNGVASGEVSYYTAKGNMADSVFPPVGQQVPQQYGGWCLEAMDAHGGWIASAIDIVKFASEFDDPNKCRLLNARSIEESFARPAGNAGLEGQKPDGAPANSWYGLGWMVKKAGDNGKVNVSHSGGLAGTSTLMVRRGDGFSWAVFFNQNTNEKGETLVNLIDAPMHLAVDRVKEWPAGKGRDEKWS